MAGTRLISLFLLLVFPLASASASISVLSEEQQSFKSALRALNSGKQAKFLKLKHGLQEYPLYSYLEFSELKKNIANVSDRSVRKFISNNQNNPLGKRMHATWLGYLAKNNYWGRYLKAWSDEFEGNTKLLCNYVRAAQFKQKDVTEKAISLWLYGNSRPDACDPVFKQLEENGVLTSDLIWERFQLSLNNRSRGLGSYLIKKLPRDQHSWYEWWTRLDKNPAATLQQLIKQQDNDRLRDLLVYGINRYARKDTVAAMLMWKVRIKARFKFSQEQIDEVERKISLLSGWRHEEDASEFLNGLQGKAVDQEVKEWRVRSELRQQNWPGVLKQIDRLDTADQGKEQWQYWKARALEVTGKESEALTIYNALSTKTSYYGFLASLKRGVPLQINSVPVVSQAELKDVRSLASQPAFLRARILRELGMNTDASREWSMAIKSLSKDEKRIAAKLAEQQGWHFRAIATVAQAGHFKDLALRFPILHEDLIRKEARRNRIQPGWVYGVIRRESAWREDVVSPAGAIGLMQLMPRTAREMAKKNGMKRPKKSQIKDVNKNIRLGTAYLRAMLNRYGEHEILATASYNAGPHRVKKWLPENASMPADVWIDTITFDETRNYVKAVFAYSTIMEWKLGEKGQSLSNRLKAIAPLNFYSS